MTNIHKDCENYNGKKDYCLKFFEENVSERYKTCREYSEFNDKELARKWSNQMTDIRFETTEDTMNDCLTITDNTDKLKNGFDSEIVLYPLEDASILVNELNVQCAINKMLREQLESYEDPMDIDYWIQEVREDME